MKKIWYLLLACLLTVYLAACGSSPSSASDSANSPAAGSSTPEVMEDIQKSESDSLVSNRTSSSSDTDSDHSMEDETSNKESEGDSIMQQNTFYVSVGGETFSATFSDNSSARALKELLSGGDITIQMSDFGGFEKVGSLGQSLPTENSQTTTQAGDIVLYQGNQIVIFYGSNSWSYTRLGKIDDLTGWEDALGSESVSATFSLTAGSQ